MNQDIPGSSKSKKKKIGYDSYFQEDWMGISEYKSWLMKLDKTTAKCKICCITFTVKHDGEKAVKTHLNSKKHKSINACISKNELITNIVPKKNTTEGLKVAIAEIAQVYHGINHHHSYLSMDCGIKLNSKIFHDSELAKKIHCGRTKAEMLVQNVLSPKSIEMVLQEMNPDSQFQVPFAIATDASNKGNRKLFPIAVRYFHIKEGIKNKVLDFYEDSDESSKAITEKIKNCLVSNDLKIENVISYAADNASVNYGKNNSVYQKLLLSNEKIFKTNCNCHVVHNASRNACKALSYDIENLVAKVFAEFSNSAKRNEELKQCFDFLDMEYAKVLRHAPTRWLSLIKAVERLIWCWPAIKSYFLQQGEENCHKSIWIFIKDEPDELKTDLDSDLTVPELYIHFVHHFMTLMTQTLLSLESNTITVTEVHAIMTALKNKLQARIDQNFFGSKVNQFLRRPTDNCAGTNKFVNEALSVYNRAMEYLMKWYNFDDNPFQLFAIFNLNEGTFSFEDVIKVVQRLQMKLNEDILFDEIHTVKSLLPVLKQSDLSVDQKWVQIFNTHNLKELTKVVAAILAMPVSNAFVESIFSLMGNIWTDERNRMSVDLVKAEICTKFNFKMTCQEFHQFVCHPDQTPLLKSISANSKYTFKLKA